MSTTARKARKRAGVKFERKAKTPTGHRRETDYLMWRHRWKLAAPHALGFFI